MSEMDATHYSYYVDEDDESIIINEEKLKASGLPYVRRYRTKSCNSSSASTSAAEVNGSAGDSLSSAGESARGNGSSADDCVNGLNNLTFSSIDNDKENRQPSQPEQVVRTLSEECKQILSQSEGDACTDPEEILAPYLEPQQCQPLARRGNWEDPVKQNASEAQLDDENSSVVMTAPLAMSTPRPSKASMQNAPYRQAGVNAKTAETVALRSPSTEIQGDLCSNVGLGPREHICINMHSPVRQRLSFVADAKAEHTFDDELFCSGVEHLPSSHVETDRKPLAHVPEIPVCDKSFIVSRELAQEKLQTEVTLTSTHSRNNEPQSSSLTTYHSSGHRSEAPHYLPEEKSKQDCHTPEVSSLATKPEISAMAHSGVEMACQTSFCVGNAPAASTVCTTPVKHFTWRSSPQKAAGSAPAKPLRERSLTGTVRGRCRTPSNIPVRGWNSPTATAKPHQTVFKVPTPVSGKTPGKAEVKTPWKSPVKSSANFDKFQAHSGTPRSVGKGTRSPWSVVSPVAKYIHENPAPPLIQIVRPRKSPSAKSLTAATSPVRTASPASPRLCTASLPDKRYQTSNMGILHRAGLDHLVKPSKPIVIKHTVSAEADNQRVADMEASVIQVIRH